MKRSLFRVLVPDTLALCLGALFAMGGCTSGGPEAGPTEADGGSSALTELGVASRVGRLSTAATSEHCARLEQSASRLAQSLRDRTQIGDVEAGVLRAKLTPFASEFGAYESLLFGEVHRVYEHAMEDSEVSDTELQRLVRALDGYGRMAGVSGKSRKEFVALLATVSSPAGAEGPLADRASQVMRKHRADVIVQVANMATDLERCAPLAE